VRAAAVAARVRWVTGRPRDCYTPVGTWPTFGTLTLWSNSRPPLTYHYGSSRSKPSELRRYRGSGWMRGAVHNEMLMRWVEMHPSCPRARDTLVPVARAVY